MYFCFWYLSCLFVLIFAFLRWAGLGELSRDHGMVIGKHEPWPLRSYFMPTGADYGPHGPDRRTGCQTTYTRLKPSVCHPRFVNRIKSMQTFFLAKLNFFLYTKFWEKNTKINKNIIIFVWDNHYMPVPMWCFDECLNI